MPCLGGCLLCSRWELVSIFIENDDNGASKIDLMVLKMKFSVPSSDQFRMHISLVSRFWMIWQPKSSLTSRVNETWKGMIRLWLVEGVADLDRAPIPDPVQLGPVVLAAQVVVRYGLCTSLYPPIRIAHPKTWSVDWPNFRTNQNLKYRNKIPQPLNQIFWALG